MANEKKPEEQFYLPPPQMSRWEGFKLFIWNSDSREFMGRTASSWGLVGLFYLIFYAGLAAFFAVMLVIFYQTLDNFEPKWQTDRSVIGSNPGLGFRPMPPEANIESTLIWFQHSSNGNYEYWADNLNTFLKPYDYGQQSGESLKDCSPENKPDPDKEVCAFRIDSLGSTCTRENMFGYRDGKPCVIIKMNRIFNWKPELYEIEDIPSLPEEVGNLVKNFSVSNPMVYLTCEGENPADRENIGQIVYQPQQGFPAYYFPYKNARNYLSPIVAVNFVNPAKGVLINIECKAWAKNIKHARMERRGCVHFELLMD